MKNTFMRGLMALTTTAALAGAGCGYSSANNPTPSASTIYTMADVQKHNSGASCWTAIDGNVYDVTSWITQHPGGEAPILSLCGIDGSAAFNNQHGGQGRPAAELASFIIGTLKQ
jgi:cytochrome b involved in lipid metabolism